MYENLKLRERLYATYSGKSGELLSTTADKHHAEFVLRLYADCEPVTLIYTYNQEVKKELKEKAMEIAKKWTLMNCDPQYLAADIDKALAEARNDALKEVELT